MITLSNDVGATSLSMGSSTSSNGGSVTFLRNSVSDLWLQSSAGTTGGLFVQRTTGFVGVNCNAPTAPLEVQGTLKATCNDASAFPFQALIAKSSNVGANAGVLITLSNDVGATSLSMGSSTSSNGGSVTFLRNSVSDLWLQSSAGTTGGLFVQRTTGFVGVNCNAPTAPLEVQGTLKATCNDASAFPFQALIAKSSNVGANAGVLITLSNDVGATSLSMGSSTSSNGGSVTFLRNSVSDLWLQSSAGTTGGLFVQRTTGFVGVNCNAPTAPLEVQGTLKATCNDASAFPFQALIAKSSNVGANAGVLITLSNDVGATSLSMGSSTSSNGGSVTFLRNSVSDLWLQSSAGTTGGLFVQRTTGFVGVNCNAPTAPLEVQGTLKATCNAASAAPFPAFLAKCANSATSSGIFWALSNDVGATSLLMGSSGAKSVATLQNASGDLLLQPAGKGLAVQLTTGYVGIGNVSNPGVPLDVANASNGVIARLLSTPFGNGLVLGAATNGTSPYLGDTGPSSTGLCLKTAGVDRLIVTATGNLGVGVQPAAALKLDVGGALGVSGTTVIDANRNVVNVVGVSASGTVVTTDKFVTVGGRIGVGVAEPSYPIQVMTNIGGISIFATNDIAAYSDVRTKRDVRRITGALARVRAINGYTFERLPQADEGVPKAREGPGRRYAGVLAHEVLEVLPEVVHKTADEGGMLSVAYGNMVAVLIEAIKELADEVHELKGERVGTM